MKVKFLKIKNIKSDFDVSSNEICSSLDSYIKWISMTYARDCYWVKNEDFYDVSDVPTDDYSFEIEWNKHLDRCIDDFTNHRLLDRIIDATIVHNTILIFNSCGKNIYVECDAEILEGLDYEDVSDEYYKKIVDDVNPTEIEEFVQNHTVDEVEEKYAAEGWEEEMWTL
jgi:hypothetical protein